LLAQTNEFLDASLYLAQGLGLQVRDSAVGDERAGTDAPLHVPGLLQGGINIAHCDGRHAKVERESSYRWQARTGRNVARGDSVF